MNVLFLTIGDFSDYKSGSVHVDLVKEIASHGHHVYVACNNIGDEGNCYSLNHHDGVTFLSIKTGTVKKNVNLIKKGIATILLERTYIKAIRKCFADVKFDLVLYHTPPVTFEKVVRYIKNRDHAVSYLLLKDIFPQNAVDLGMMRISGLKGLVYHYFRWKEKNLYKASDYIGCMSPANVEYLLRHNSYLDPSKIEVAPNSIDSHHIYSCEDSKPNNAERYNIRKKYRLPVDKPVFIYGGNLGKPQGIDFLIKCLNINKDRSDCFFMIVGDGSEYDKIAEWYELESPQSVSLHKSLPNDDYNILVRSCDVGLIFLDHRFTIPNYPSRLLSYLVNSLPVICATDPKTDIGRIAEENGYGYWCESNNPDDFKTLIDKMLESDMKSMGKRGFDFLCKHYLAEHTYNVIFNHL